MTSYDSDALHYIRMISLVLRHGASRNDYYDGYSMWYHTFWAFGMADVDVSVMISLLEARAKKTDATILVAECLNYITS